MVSGARRSGTNQNHLEDDEDVPPPLEPYTPLDNDYTAVHNHTPSTSSASAANTPSSSTSSFSPPQPNWYYPFSSTPQDTDNIVVTNRRTGRTVVFVPETASASEADYGGEMAGGDDGYLTM